MNDRHMPENHVSPQSSPPCSDWERKISLYCGATESGISAVFVPQVLALVNAAKQLCAPRDVSKNSGYVQYRHGRQDRVDLADAFVSGATMFSGGGGVL